MKKSMVFLTIFCAGMFALNLVIDEPAQGAEIRDAAYCPCVMFCSPCPPEENDEAKNRRKLNGLTTCLSIAGKAFAGRTNRGCYEKNAEGDANHGMDIFPVGSLAEKRTGETAKESKGRVSQKNEK